MCRSLKSGKQTQYRWLPATVVIFITMDDIFGMDRAMYTFTECCRELPELELGDGVTKIFCNMTSKMAEKNWSVCFSI